MVVAAVVYRKFHRYIFDFKYYSHCDACEEMFDTETNIGHFWNHILGEISHVDGNIVSYPQ